MILPLDRRVAAHAQQQRDLGQLIDGDFDRAMHDVLQARRSASALGGPLVEHREQRVERAPDSARQQLFLAANVIVDAGLGDAGRARDVVECAAVVAALAEHAHRNVEDRVEVVRFPLASPMDAPRLCRLPWPWVV